MIHDETIIGDCRLILGDCLEVLPGLPTVDAVVTDPPYGIGCEKHHGRKCGGKAVAAKKDYGYIGWDEKRPDKHVIDAILHMSQRAIIWGGNYFELPPMGGWLVWDKDNGANHWADCELAWTNIETSTRKFRYRWMGMLQENMGNKERRVHPTQKPIALLNWCLSFVEGETILDPFMGSGTTGVACIQTGRKFIGIEIDPKYYAIAVKRCKEAWGVGQLFDDSNKVEPASLFAEASCDSQS